VITRYLYKPDAAEGMTRFNDNRRLHLFMVDVASGRVEQLTDGAFYEHSVDWSPNGQEIAFLTNRDADHDEFFNYDVYVMKVADKSIRRLSATESNEYHPAGRPTEKCWRSRRRSAGSPIAKRRWKTRTRGSSTPTAPARREIGTIDNRQGPPEWTPDGRALLFTVQERGSVHLYRQPIAGGKPELVVGDRGTVSGFSMSRTVLAYTLATPSDLAQLYIAGRKMTDLNADVLRGKPLADVESFTFVSNDNKFEVEAFLTKPIGLAEGTRHPLIVNIHGGPHGQQGPAFNFKNQVYAARGWATLMVNYRGSTGYSPGVLGRGLRRSERQRRAGRALRRQRGAAALSRGSIAIASASRARATAVSSRRG
jgi:dipeptidyl aminopeptidase/acylaminoacyl peptidase